jgi:hypothetical protein
VNPSASSLHTLLQSGPMLVEAGRPVGGLRSEGSEGVTFSRRAISGRAVRDST